jgi:hypothetical protein
VLLAQREDWAQMPFPVSGSFVVRDALNRVEVDHERDRAVDREENLWVQQDPDLTIGLRRRLAESRCSGGRSRRYGLGREQPRLDPRRKPSRRYGAVVDVG